MQVKCGKRGQLNRVAWGVGKEPCKHLETQWDLHLETQWDLHRAQGKHMPGKGSREQQGARVPKTEWRSKRVMSKR